MLGFSFLFNGLEPLKPLVTELHKRNSDIYETYQIIDQITEDLKYQRWIRSLVFYGTKDDRCSWGEKSKPRTTKCFSAHRDNVPSDDIKSYWRRIAAVPVMDNLIAQLIARVSDRLQTSLFMLLPSLMFSHDDEIFEKILREIGKNFWGFEINYAIRKEFLQEIEKPRKHLPVQRQQYKHYMKCIQS